MDGIPEFEGLDQLGKVVGVGVHVVAGPRLAGAPVAAAVMGDAAIAAGSQKYHLVLPGVCAEWPAVAEHHGLATAQSL